MQGNEGPSKLESIRSLQCEVNEAVEIEESKWRQRAKEQWLKLGDKNSKYFHACAYQRSRRNKIDRIVDEGGTVCTSPEEIENAFIHYYQNLFSSAAPEGLEETLHGLVRRIQPDMNAQLTCAFTDEEIKGVVRPTDGPPNPQVQMVFQWTFIKTTRRS